MTFIVRMLRFLFLVVIVSWAVAILRRIVRQIVRGNTGSKPYPYMDVPNNSVNQKLVRDPVCGMHLAPELAVPLKQGGEVLHFCSAECRDKFLNGNQKISASA
jgi:YHS domain-containing protein